MKLHSFLLLSSVACVAQALRIPFSSRPRSLASRSAKLSVSRPGAALANIKVLASTTDDDDDIDITFVPYLTQCYLHLISFLLYRTVKDLLYMANVCSLFFPHFVFLFLLILIIKDHCWWSRYASIAPLHQLAPNSVLLLSSEYTVQLDTGSSDLWVKGDSSPLPNTNQTVRAAFSQFVYIQYSSHLHR